METFRMEISYKKLITFPWMDSASRKQENCWMPPKID